MQKLKAYLSLMRPANIVTALSDIWAGAAIAGFFTGIGSYRSGWLPLICLSAATAGLYGGGVVFNDVFDAELDKTERPERPIPGGKATLRGAAVLGIALLCAGILAGCMVGASCGGLAFAIAAAALAYDRFSKPHAFAGPLNMGLCRGLNLLLGVSIVPSALLQWWPLLIVPVIYIAAVTMISRGEVHGGKKSILSFAAVLYLLVILVIFFFARLNHRQLLTAPFLALFAALIFPPLLRAMKDPAGPRIGGAVKAGVIALIAMNASWAAAFSSWPAALAVLVLLPLSLLLARLFAVT